MGSVESLKKEIDSLKKQSKQLNQRFISFEKNQDKLSGRISAIEERISIPDIKEEKNKHIIGIIMIIIGGLLCFSVIGAIIGIPILIWGAILVNKNSRKEISEPKNYESKEKLSLSTKEEISLSSKKEELKKFTSFEDDVGMKWFSRIGILALVIGVGFFIKYAIDMNWINHLTRIIIGTVFGIGLIIFGEFVSRKEKYANWAKTLVGGGFAITYFVIFAAYHFPEYQSAIGISQTLDIILLSLVVIFAILFSLKDNSQIIAAESFFLGYITSLLSNDFGFMTLVYGLLLTIGLVTVVSYKKWSVIGLGGVVASYIMYLFWFDNNPDSFLYASFILISYFTAFTLQSFFLIKKKEFFLQNIFIILINSLLFFIFYYIQVDKHFPDYSGLFALILSLLYFAGFFLCKRMSTDNFATLHMYLGILFLTLTIPIQLNKEWVTIIWALETLILTILSFKLNLKTLRISSYVLGAITGFKTLFYDITFLQGLDIVNILNSSRLFSFIATILTFYFISWYLKINKDSLDKSEYILAEIYSYAATIATLILILLEMQEFWISVGWSVLALIMIISGFLFRKDSLRFQGIIIFTITILKVFLYDTRNLETIYRTISYIVLGAILLLVSFIYTKYNKK